MVAEPIPQAEYAAWLTSPRVIRSDGSVMSWVNPEHPGYPYPEIAGYMLSYLSLHGRETAPTRNRIAQRLLRQMAPSGAVGRRETEYVFDSAMVLAGLLAHEANGGLLPDAAMIDRLRDYIVRRLERRVGLDGALEAAPEHWSASYGCHLIKTFIALTAYDATRATHTTPLIERMLAELLPLYDRGRFHVNADSDITYVHAHCYALEGLLVLDGRGRSGLRSWIEGGAEWLAAGQAPNGGMPAEFDSDGPRMEAHADCTAQAVRIWAAVDRQRYAAEIERGLDYLASLTIGGGIRYRDESSDVNTWATIFGAQAMDWAQKGGSWQWLI